MKIAGRKTRASKTSAAEKLRAKERAARRKAASGPLDPARRKAFVENGHNISSQWRAGENSGKSPWIGKVFRTLPEDLPTADGPTATSDLPAAELDPQVNDMVRDLVEKEAFLYVRGDDK